MTPTRTTLAENIVIRLICLVCIALAAITPGRSQTIAGDALRGEFLIAYELARNGLPPAEGTPLRDYLLYPYLQAAWLSRDLMNTGPDWSDQDNAVVTFLAEHPGQPVTFNLRLNWLRSLADRELWPAFIEHFRTDVANTALRCRLLQARIALNDTEDIETLILDEWLSGFQLPLECEPVFQWLRDNGGLADEQTEARVRLLIENGQTDFALVIARRLPDERASPLIKWAELIDSPLNAINDWLVNDDPEVSVNMLLDGWSKLARDQPESAVDLFDSLTTRLESQGTDADEFTLALAYGLAWDRRTAALDYFSQVSEEHMDDYALGWQTRAALWAGDTELARDSISSMSEVEKRTAQWLYWAARVSDSRETRNWLEAAFAANDNYFSASAAAHRRDRPSIHPSNHPADGATISRLGSNPAMQRAGELWRIGLTESAAREWRYAYEQFDAAERSQSVHLAMQMDWRDLAIVTATENGIFFDYELLYPRPFTDEVMSAAREFDLDPWLIWSVMRQESLYRIDAVSSAGALGLMQLTRGTAADLSRELDDIGASPDLLSPGINIRLGAARLAAMLDRYDDQVVPALAAYNAGPAAADRWLPEEPIPGDIWLENIPYNETREYVRRVLWNTVVFAALDGETINARRWLQDIATD